MPRKRHAAEEIVTQPRQVDVLSSQGIHRRSDPMPGIGLSNPRYRDVAVAAPGLKPSYRVGAKYSKLGQILKEQGL